jgi:dTDP-4-amino-4,6-dideoxygalactose transaminase
MKVSDIFVRMSRRREASMSPVQIPFSLPDIGESEIDAVVGCLRSGWLTTGSRTAAFEHDFAAFVGGGVEAVAVSSATAGLEIARAVQGVGCGDEVITSDYTFTATAMSVVHRGAKPVLVDIDPQTFNLDANQVEAAITPRTKAIIPVHFAGLACDMTAIGELAQRHGLKVIEDAAHALPTKVNNRMIGQGTSDATVFSFYASKTITTGEGGMVTFADPNSARRARILRLHGISKDSFARNGNGQSWHYEVVAPGFKSNMSDIAAAIGLVQLKRAWDFHWRRAELWAAYDAGLADLPVLLPPQAPPGDIHALHLYALRLRDDARLDRDTFVTKMAEAGVACSVHFIPLHLHPYWRDALGIDATLFPEAQRAYEREVTLPLFTALTDDKQHFVIDTISYLLA